MVTIEPDGTVNFSLDEPSAIRVDLVGAFDGWHEQHIPMTHRPDGSWQCTLDLRPGAYLFRYLIDNRHWRLDDDAHGEHRSADGTPKSRVWRPAIRLDPDSLAA